MAQRNLWLIGIVLGSVLTLCNSVKASDTGWVNVSPVPTSDLALQTQTTGEVRVWSADGNGFSSYDQTGAIVGQLRVPEFSGVPVLSTDLIAASNATTVWTYGVCCPAKSSPQLSVVVPGVDRSASVNLNGAFDIGRVGFRARSLATDREGRPWLLTDSGLWVMIRGHATPLDVGDDVWVRHIVDQRTLRFGESLTSAPDGTIWLLTVVDGNNAFATPYGVEDETVAPRGTGTFWVNRGVAPRRAVIRPDGTVLFLLADRIVRRAVDGPDEVIVNRDVFNADLRDAVYVGDTLWVATTAGVFRQATTPSTRPATQRFGPLETVADYNIQPAPGLAWGDLFSAPDPAGYWRRTDAPVVNGAVSRSFYWGPEAWGRTREPYRDAPFGTRRVLYYDKARMEVTNPAVATVTNGLLVVEMVTSRMQLGDATFIEWSGIDEPVAGDPGSLAEQVPTYRSFQSVFSLTPGSYAPRITQRVSQTINATGEVGVNQQLALPETQLVVYDSVTGHNIPKVFNDFLGAQGRVYVAGSNMLRTERIIDPLVAMGRPVTEPYWVRVPVAGVQRDVLVQLFERRVLTYTPSNPAAFQVEMGNVGQHYYRWRYFDQPWQQP